MKISIKKQVEQVNKSQILWQKKWAIILAQVYRKTLPRVKIILVNRKHMMLNET